MKYKFLCDFPPTGWKKGDEVSPSLFNNLSFSYFEVAFLLKLGVIEEVKEVKEWKPSYGKTYWAVSTSLGLRAQEREWYDHDDDENLLETGNYFKTEEEAKAAAEHLKKALQEFRENK